MRHIVLYLALPLISFAQSSQNIAATWFPTHVGDKWVYDHETRDDEGGGREHPRIERWRTEESIIGSWTIPEGTLVVRQARIIGPPPSYLPLPPPMNAYLIRGDCLYLNYVAWQQSTHQLTAEFRIELAAGHISPDFCFPLRADKTWGAPHWGDWRPASAVKDWQVLNPVTPKTFQIRSISSYPGSGEKVNIWFEKGVGIVRQLDVHNGTYGETRTQLVHFEPALPQ